MTTLPSAAHVGRIALRVSDLDELVAFYRDVVGLTVRARDGERATLGTDRIALLELVGDADAPARPPDAAGLFHTAFRVPSRSALADALSRVRAEWRLSGASDHGVSEALYLQDPEGNGVEIYCDRPRETWSTNADGHVEMKTAPLDLDALATEATGTSSVPPESDVGHVHLEVTSLRAARDFYADALGMTVRQETRGAAFFAAGEYHHHVGCNVWNGRSTGATGRGLEWFEVVVPPAALRAVRERFETAGVTVQHLDGAAVPGAEPADAEAADAEPNDGEARSEPRAFAVTDPDGIGLRVRAGE